MKKAWCIQLQLLHVGLKICIQIHWISVRVKGTGNLNDAAMPKVRRRSKSLTLQPEVLILISSMLLLISNLIGVFILKS